MLALLSLPLAGLLFTALGQGHTLRLRANVGCSFRMAAVSNATRPIGQLANGQARAGGGIPASIFTWFGDDFVDQQGRGCWLTPPTTVLQCDANQEPNHGFDIGCDGTVMYNGQSGFYECGTETSDEVNIYLAPDGGDCHPIALQADGCRDCDGSAPSSSQHATASGPTSAGPSIPSITTSNPQAQTPDTASSTSFWPTSSFTSTSTHTQSSVLPVQSIDCPTDQSAGPFSSPALLVPVDKANPDKRYGSSRYGQVSANATSIFNFPISAADAGKICKVLFVLPSRDSSNYYLTGDGRVSFARLSEPADANTTYSNVEGANGMARRKLGDVQMVPGHTYVIESLQCPVAMGAESTILAYEISEASGSDTCLVYMQQLGGTPTGLFISKC